MFDNNNAELSDVEVQEQYHVIEGNLKDPVSAEMIEFRPAKPTRGAHKTPAAWESDLVWLEMCDNGLIELRTDVPSCGFAYSQM